VVEVGGLGTLAQSMQAVGFGGEIALIGVLSMQGDGNPMPLMLKGATLRGIFVGSAAMAQELNGFVDQHALKPVVDRVFDSPTQGGLYLPGLGRAVRQGRHRQSA
jgi:NADPH:quinone reductase-like Zn-dependent oxidoreductase